MIDRLTYKLYNGIEQVDVDVEHMSKTCLNYINDFTYELNFKIRGEDVSYKGSTGTSTIIVSIRKKKNKKKIKCCANCEKGRVTRNEKEVFCTYYKQFKKMYQDRQLACLVKKH